MAEYFDNNNHITKDGFKALVNGKLTRSDSLKLSEHLSECDDCLLKYTEYLSVSALIEPPPSLEESIIKRLRLRIAAIFANKYVTVSAAACVALMFWVGGVFEPENISSVTDFSDTIIKSSVEFSEKTKELSNNISEIISNIIGGNFNEKK